MVFSLKIQYACVQNKHKKSASVQIHLDCPNVDVISVFIHHIWAPKSTNLIVYENLTFKDKDVKFN